MIAIDWGTSSLRAYLVQDGKVLASRETEQGILSIPTGGFRQVFDDITQDWNGDVYMSGMIGSSKGWLETQYCSTPFQLADLGQYLVEATHLTDRPSWIVPGVKQDNPPNMMRGEETQILGAIGSFDNECMILCGTHSKHVQVNNDTLIQFETFMTGELYALLKTHSILAGPEDWKLDDFVWGVTTGARNKKLLQQLFTVRAQTLNKKLSHPRAYLSGLLIGSELGEASLLKDSLGCTLIGSPRLMRPYKIALEELYPSLNIDLFSAEDATLEGLKYIHWSHNAI